MSADLEESEEIQLLAAMYPDEFSCSRSATGAVVQLNLTPMTAMDESHSFVKCSVVFELGQQYPTVLPNVDVRHSRGMDDEQVKAMEKQLLDKAQTLLGEPMLFELTELAKEILTANNVPRAECIVCLCTFEEDPPEEFMKTHCFHYFHRSCLAGWCFSSGDVPQPERMPGQPAPPPAAPKYLCPSCRQPLNDTDLALLKPHLEPLYAERDRQNAPPPVADVSDDVAADSEADWNGSEYGANGADAASDAVASGPSAAADAAAAELEAVKLAEDLERGPVSVLIRKVCSRVNPRLLTTLCEPFGGSNPQIHYKSGRRVGTASVDFPTLRQAKEAIKAVNGQVIVPNEEAVTVEVMPADYMAGLSKEIRK